MNSFIAVIFLCASFFIETVVSQGVIELTKDNFEQLTQAASGATNGDWLVKFYAPWCPHSKDLEPSWYEVAEDLAGTSISVARVDVMANRELGVRFDIEGFPMIKLFKKGYVYSFQGRRTTEEIVDFARSGHEIQKPEKCPPAWGWFGEVAHVYRHAYKTATKDIADANYFTVDVFLISLPILFSVLMLIVCLIPMPPIPKPGEVGATGPRSIPNSSLSSRTDARAPGSRFAPPTSSRDGAKKQE